MTVSSTTTKNSYNGDGTTVAFSYTFRILDEDDIAVILRNNATGNETTQSISTNYSVSGVGDVGGGTITFVTAPPTGNTVVLLRATPLTQITDYTPNDPFPAESHESALDKLTFITQELSEEIGRSLKLSQTNEIATAEFTAGAAARANKVLGFDSAGDLTVLQEIGIYKGTDTTVTTAAYDPRDLVKSTTAAELDNVYIALQASPLGTSLTNTTYWALIVDAVSAATSATNAATSASDAEKLAVNAEDSQYTLSDSSTGYSALHYAAKAEDFKDVAITQAGNSLSSATAADNAMHGSIAARNAAFLALDDFDDVYLGSMADGQTQSVVNTTATWVTTVAQETQITVADATGISVGMVITSASGFLAGTNVLSVVGNTVYLNNLNQNAATNQSVTFTGHGVFGDFDGTKDGPSTNNDNSALVGGELYYNSTDSMLRYYNGGSSSWDDVILSSANLALVNTVAGQISPTNNIATVAGIDGDITTVAGINTTHLSNVSGVATEIGRLGTADAVADMNTLGTAAVVTDMDTLADRATDIATLADIEDGTTATNAIQTVAANVSGVTSFAEVYRSGATDPTTGLDEGDLFFNTTSDTLKVYNGTAWEAGVTAGSGFLPLSGGQLTGNLTFLGSETVDGRDVSVDGTKLDGIEAGATADQTGAEIKSAYEAEADTNAFTDAEKTKLTGIEASADVTDTTNVTAAGALMDSEVTNLAQVKAFDSADYATAAQGTLADNALPKSGGTLTGTLTLGANVINDVKDIYLRDRLYHDADTNTYLNFASDAITLTTGGSDGLSVYSTYIRAWENVVGSVHLDTNQGTGTHTPDFQNYNSFVWTLTGDINLGNPSTEIAGMSGVFIFTHSGAGRTVSPLSQYETIDGGALTLSGASGAVDIVPYFVRSTGNIMLGKPLLNFVNAA